MTTDYTLLMMIYVGFIQCLLEVNVSESSMHQGIFTVRFR
jgi:hypothetical protein